MVIISDLGMMNMRRVAIDRVREYHYPKPIKIHFPEPHVVTEAERQEILNSLIDQVDSFICYGDTIINTETVFDRIEQFNQEHDPFNPMIGLDICSEGEPIGMVQSVNDDGTVWVYITGNTDLQDAYIHAINSQQHVSMGFDGTATLLKNAKIDEKYPHTCQKCGEVLRFNELSDASYNITLKINIITDELKKYGLCSSVIENSKIESWFIKKGEYEYKKYLKRLWKSPYVKFYCCGCYAKELEPVGNVRCGDYDGFTHVVRNTDEFEWL